MKATCEQIEIARTFVEPVDVMAHRENAKRYQYTDMQYRWDTFWRAVLYSGKDWRDGPPSVCVELGRYRY